MFKPKPTAEFMRGEIPDFKSEGVAEVLKIKTLSLKNIWLLLTKKEIRDIEFTIVADKARWGHVTGSKDVETKSWQSKK